jgi:hypothetical protein
VNPSATSGKRFPFAAGAITVQRGVASSAARPAFAQELRDLLLDAEAADDPHATLNRLRFHRQRAFELGEEAALLEALPLAKRLELDQSAPSRVREGATDYVKTTSSALGHTPLASAYEAKSIEFDVEGLGRWRVHDQRERAFQLVWAAGVAAAGILLALLGRGFSSPFHVLPAIGLTAFSVGVFAAVAVAVRAWAQMSTVDAELERLHRKQELTAAVSTSFPRAVLRTPESAGSQYFTNLVQINVSNLGDYYTLVKVHTNNSFRAALAAGVVGFALILFGIGIGFTGAQTSAYVATVSGVVVEFIAGVFFYLYNRTVRQLKEYHDSLLEVQNILLAFKIVEDSEAEQRRTLFEKILIYLLYREGSSVSSLAVRDPPPDHGSSE